MNSYLWEVHVGVARSVFPAGTAGNDKYMGEMSYWTQFPFHVVAVDVLGAIIFAQLQTRDHTKGEYDTEVVSVKRLFSVVLGPDKPTKV